MDEKNTLIATRIPNTDSWELNGKEDIGNSLTETLELYFELTGWKGDFRLSPSDSKLYIIEKIEIKEKKSKPIVKKYNIYGDKEE